MESVIIISLAVIAALLTTARVKKIALKYGIGSLPDNRKIHVGFVPYLGGIGIYVGGLVGLIVAIMWKEYYLQTFTVKYAAIIFGATLMLVTGALDDAHGLPAIQKFIIQFIASTIVIFSGCRIDTIINPFGDPVQMGVFSIPVTYLWLMGITNAINLLDGLDGLAAGVGLIAISTFSVIAFQQQDWMTFAICLAVMGGLLGFLRYNYHPATIFMGDTGSLFLGFLLAAIALRGLQNSAGNIDLLIPIITLTVPIGDTTLAFFRRLNRGQHPFSPDKDHLHHRLLFLGLSHRQAVHIIYLFSFLFGLTAYLISTESRIYGIVLLILVLLLAIFSLYRLGYLEAQKIKTYLGDQSIIQVKKEMAPLSMRRFWHKFVLFLADFMVINLVFIITYWFRFHSGFFKNVEVLPVDFYVTSGVWLILSIFFILLFALNGLYNMRWDVSRFDQILRISRVIILGALVFFIVTLEPDRIFAASRLTLVLYSTLLLVLLNLSRLVLISIEKKLSALEYAPHKTLLIGTSDQARNILKEIRSNPHLLYDVIGVVDKIKPKRTFSNLPYLGRYENIPKIIRENGVEEVIIAINEKSRDEILNIVAYGENMRVSFKIIPQMYDVVSGHKTEEIVGHPLIRLFPDQMQPWQWLLKRGIDVLISLIGLILLSPLFLFIFFLQVISGIYPFLVIADRVGKQGKIFGLLQFNAGEGQEKISKFLFESNLYKTSQIVNVLLGSLSLVGPQPEYRSVVEELRTRIKFYNRRFMVRPGLTGWAQLKNRTTATYRQRLDQFKQDLFYLENMSLLLDLRILLRASLRLFMRKKRN
jgi:UDP-GlcNAc:undecaprenyl-phosphate GlcNAc-1-phosphate transferase